MKKLICILLLTGCSFSSAQKNIAEQHARDWANKFYVQNYEVSCTSRYFHGPNSVECYITNGQTNIALVCSVHNGATVGFESNACKQIRGH